MKTRTTLIAVLAMAAGAYAQRNGPGPGHGPMGFGGPQPGARFLGAEAGMPGRVVKNAPYSADVVTEATQTLPDGNHIRQATNAKVYRDTEGRTRREQSVNLNGLASDANLPQVVFIADPVAGVNYALNARDKSATKSVFRAGGRSGSPNPNGQAPHQRLSDGTNAAGQGTRFHGPRNADQNIRSESLGRQIIEGVQADGTRITMTIPAGQMGNELPIQIVTETWYSPELQTMVLSKRNDPRAGESVTRLTNISRSEPSRTLFEPPVDYKVTEGGRMGRGTPMQQ